MQPALEAVKRQLGTERPGHLAIPPNECERFSEEVPETIDDATKRDLAARAEALHPWLQGPFWLGGDLVIGGTWRNDQRWRGLQGHMPDVRGRRVLDVGSNAGYDPFMFAKLGAKEVVACEPFEFIEQMRFLEGVYRTGIEIHEIGWQSLDPEQLGRFDFVHCHGVLYHELHPMAMLMRLASMVAPGGTLLLGSMMLADAEHSEYARFVPGAYYGDETWWWVPGRVCLRRMIEAAGLVAEGEFGLAEGPPGEFRTVNGYVRSRPLDA